MECGGVRCHAAFLDAFRSPVGTKKDRPHRFATLPHSHNAGSSPSLCQPALRFYTTTRLQVAILQQKMLHARRFVVFLETFFMKTFFMPAGLLVTLCHDLSQSTAQHKLHTTTPTSAGHIATVPPHCSASATTLRATHGPVGS